MMTEFGMLINKIFEDAQISESATIKSSVTSADKYFQKADRDVQELEKTLGTQIIKGLTILIKGIKGQRDVGDIYVSPPMNDRTNGRIVNINVVTDRDKDQVLFDVAKSLKTYTGDWLEIKPSQVNNRSRTFRGDIPRSSLTIKVVVKGWPGEFVDLTPLIKRFPYVE